VSRRHARLEREETAGWLLTDLGSRNGTRVNGWRVRDSVQVRPGDLVRFGDVVYVLGAPD
jgi:pSer/pThr/pTyr-binding forkhead associated (FHA) protein